METGVGGGRKMCFLAAVVGLPSLKRWVQILHYHQQLTVNV